MILRAVHPNPSLEPLGLLLNAMQPIKQYDSLSKTSGEKTHIAQLHLVIFRHSVEFKLD